MAQVNCQRSRGLSQLSIDANARYSGTQSGSDSGSLGESVEISHLSECPEDERKQAPFSRPRMRQRAKTTGEAGGEEKPNKALVDPRKYKTKLCRNWKATGACPYEHTCCYAHGDFETRTMHQNNNVLSSLGYFSGIMLLAMKDDKQGGKGAGKGKKVSQKNVSMNPQYQPEEPQQVPQPEPQPQPQQLAVPQSNSPIVHSPYCLPDGPSFGTESGPASPLNFDDTVMPSYSFRMEGYPKSPPFEPTYAPYPDSGHYEVHEYCMPGAYSYPTPHSPLDYGACYPSYDAYSPEFTQQQLEAHQAALEKHPAVRNLQAGDMSQKQLQKVLHDIMYTNKQRRTRKRSNPLEAAVQE